MRVNTMSSPNGRGAGAYQEPSTSPYNSSMPPPPPPHLPPLPPLSPTAYRSPPGPFPHHSPHRAQHRFGFRPRSEIPSLQRRSLSPTTMDSKPFIFPSASEGNEQDGGGQSHTQPHTSSGHAEHASEELRSVQLSKSPSSNQQSGWPKDNVNPPSTFVPTGFSPITAWFLNNKGSAGLPPGSARLPTPRWPGGNGHEPLTPSVWLGNDPATTSTGFTPTFAQPPFNHASSDANASPQQQGLNKWFPGLATPQPLQSWNHATLGANAAAAPADAEGGGDMNKATGGGSQQSQLALPQINTGADLLTRPHRQGNSDATGQQQPISTALTTTTTMSRTDLYTGGFGMNSLNRPRAASPNRLATSRAPGINDDATQSSLGDGNVYSQAGASTEVGSSVPFSTLPAWNSGPHQSYRPLNQTGFPQYPRANEHGAMAQPHSFQGMAHQPLIGTPPIAARAPRSRRIDANTSSIGVADCSGALNEAGGGGGGGTWPSSNGDFQRQGYGPPHERERERNPSRQQSHVQQQRPQHAQRHKTATWPVAKAASGSGAHGQPHPYSIGPSTSASALGHPPGPLGRNAHLYATDDARWEAVQARDSAASAAFFYCVLTTKVSTASPNCHRFFADTYPHHCCQIFCRTTCPSRRPLRSSIFFVDTASQASALGYRACRRCKPDVSGGDPHEERQEKVIAQVKERLLASVHRGSNGKAAKGKGLKYIAEDLGVSHWHLHRCFKKRVGATPEAWAKMQAKKLRVMDVQRHAGGYGDGYEEPLIADGSPLTPSSSDRSSMRHDVDDKESLAMSPRYPGGGGGAGGPSSDFAAQAQRSGTNTASSSNNNMTY